MAIQSFIFRGDRPPWISVLAGLILSGLMSGFCLVTVQSSHAAEPCALSTRDRPDAHGYDYEEINNCPPLSGTFQNRRWQVQFGHWEPAVFFYRGVHRRTGNLIELISDEIHGTSDRPEYIFHNGNTSYTVTFRPDDPNTIRLQVFQNGRRLLNQLLTRMSD